MVSNTATSSSDIGSDIIASLPMEGMDREDSFDDYVGSMQKSATFDLGAPDSPEAPPKRDSAGSVSSIASSGVPHIDQWSPKKSFLVSLERTQLLFGKATL